MELEVFTTNVELQDIPSYTTNITVEGQLLKLSFMWNERIGKRTLYITDSADQCYLQNTILHPNEPFELNANAVLNDLPYSVTLIKTGDQKRVGNIFNWSKDFILCFSRTVDVEVEKLNVVYGVTKPSTPTTPKPPPPYGAWILNQGYEIVGDDIKYTAYKTNSLNYYDSFALSDLEQALVKSFRDPDLQQYAAFTTAVEQLIGVVAWTLDAENNQIKYLVPEEGKQEQCWLNSSYTGCYLTAAQAASASCNGAEIYYITDQLAYANCADGSTATVIAGSNPNYDPEAIEERILPLDVVAQKVVSNAESGEDEVLQLLSQDYITIVINSIFETNPSKQFVKLEDLIPQLEANKVLRD